MAQKSQKARAKPAPAPAVAVDEIEVPQAKVVDRDAREPWTQARVGVFILVALGGWAFILASNKFHVTAPAVFVCLGYLALMFTVVNLWRTGAAAAAPSSEDEGWGRPIGARGELEKEKRTLLKGIKEAEFDAAMGKLSKADADSLVRDYRARAIDVIKEIDLLSADSAMSIRDQIALEVRARVTLDASDKPSNRAKKLEQARAEARRAMAAEPKTSSTAPAPAAAAVPAAAQPKQMPAKLMAIVAILFLGSILNFVGGSPVGIVIAILQIALAIGVLSGNDGVRMFLRGLAVAQILLMLVTIVMGVAEASDQGVGSQLIKSPLFWLIVVVGVGTPSFLLWSLGQHDVRDWMFQRSFGLTPASKAPGGDDEDDEDDDEGGRVAAMKAKVAAAEERAAIAEAKAAAVTADAKPNDVIEPTKAATDAAPGFVVPDAAAKAKANAEADAIAARVQADKVALAEAKAAAAQAAAEAAEAKAAAARAAAEAAEAKVAAADGDDSKGERA